MAILTKQPRKQVIDLTGPQGNVYFLMGTAMKLCKELDLDILGTMCIPPDDNNQNLYFSNMQKINSDLGYKELSMGMSNDYLNALEFKSSFLRIGSKIFGARS